MMKKLNNMLHCIITMAKFDVRTDIINIFHNSTIDGVWRYCLVAWCCNATMADIEHMDSIIGKSSKVITIPQPYIHSIYKGLLSIVWMVWTDTKHPLHVYLHNNII